MQDSEATALCQLDVKLYGISAVLAADDRQRCEFDADDEWADSEPESDQESEVDPNDAWLSDDSDDEAGAPAKSQLLPPGNSSRLLTQQLTKENLSDAHQIASPEDADKARPSKSKAQSLATAAPSVQASGNLTAAPPKPRRPRYVGFGMSPVDAAITLVSQMITLSNQLTSQEAEMLIDGSSDAHTFETDKAALEQEMQQQLTTLGSLITDPDAEQHFQQPDQDGDDSAWESESQSDTDSDEDEDQRTTRKSNKIAAIKAALAMSKIPPSKTRQCRDWSKSAELVHPQISRWYHKLHYSKTSIAAPSPDPIRAPMAMSPSMSDPATVAISSGSSTAPDQPDQPNYNWQATCEFLLTLDDLAQYDLLDSLEPDTPIELAHWRAILACSPWRSKFSLDLADMFFAIAQTKALKTLTLADACLLYCWLGPISLQSHQALPPVGHIIPFINYVASLDSDVWAPPFTGIMMPAEIDQRIDGQDQPRQLVSLNWPRALTGFDHQLVPIYRNLDFWDATNPVQKYSCALSWSSQRGQLMLPPKPPTGSRRYRFADNATSFNMVNKLVEHLAIFYKLPQSIVTVTDYNCLAEPQ